MSSQREPYTSPPRTPPSQTSTAKYRPKRGYNRPSIRDAFPDAAVEARASDSGDERDPHDLSLSPQHAARTSIVDNMLLSLDQFGASEPSFLDDYRLFNSAFESETNGRYRGHTFSSSSVSSEAEYGFEDSSGRYATMTASKGRRSNSSSNHQSATAPRRMSSARSRDAMGSRSGTIPRAGNVRKGSKGSSTDYNYTMPRGRADSGGVSRRSESFDCGPQKYSHWTESNIVQDSLLYDDDAAPTPSVPAGPRKAPDYNRTPTAASSKTPVASRRNSMKSNHPPPQARKGRLENIGTGALKMRDSDYHLHGDTDLDAPPAIPASLDPPAPSPTVSYNKPAFPQPEPNATITTTTITANVANAGSNASTKERPGFFRRVFGSGKAASPGPADSGSNVNDLSYLQDNEIKDSTGATANLKLRKEPPKSSAGTPTKRDGPQQVIKQKSSFFRRRKKSVTDSSVPPPIILPQEISPHMMDSMKPEPSPVSSLRQVMNPYLDRAPGNQNQEVKERLDGQTPFRESTLLQAQRPRESVSAPGGTQKAKQQSLQPPSAGRLQDRSPADGRGTKDQASGAAEVEPAASTDFPLQEKSPNAAPAALSPVAEDFSRNLKITTKTASTDASRESLAGTVKLEIPSDSHPPESPAVSEASHYQTASNTPVIETEEPQAIDDEDTMDGPGEAVEDGATPTDREQAQKLFDSQDQVVGNEPAAAWLGDPDRATIREAYMRLFNWSNLNILAALRNLCQRLILKGETQQVDRVLDAFSCRWCDCNPSHGFKATGKVDLSDILKLKCG